MSSEINISFPLSILYERLKSKGSENMLVSDMENAYYELAEYKGKALLKALNKSEFMIALGYSNENKIIKFSKLKFYGENLEEAVRDFLGKDVK
jgi:hypothetical protein